MAKAKSDLDDAIERDGKAAERECAFGDRQELRRAAELVEETAKVTSGGKSERLFIKETFELPAHATAWQREECARAIVEDWAKRDHPAVAVVHGNGRVQPRASTSGASWRRRARRPGRWTPCSNAWRGSARHER